MANLLTSYIQFRKIYCHPNLRIPFGLFVMHDSYFLNPILLYKIELIYVKFIYSKGALRIIKVLIIG